MAGGPRASSGRRLQQQSLCAQPVPEGRPFHRSLADDHAVRAEIFATLEATGKPAVALAGLVGDVNARMRAAARGQLRGSKDLKPVRDFPTLWELRWDFRKDGLYRMYHAEPDEAPRLVALRFHRKDISSADPTTIDRLQHQEMDLAATRYKHGTGARWGHRRDRCSECLDPDPTG